jgi:hypothetical protein
MGRSVGLIGVIVLACVLGTGAATAAEAPETPLAFAKTDPLSATCAELASEGGVDVTIRNDTGANQLAKLALAEFSDADGSPVATSEVCGGLAVNPPELPLEGAGSATVKLEGKSAEEGSFTGTLTLSTAQGRVARRGVSIISEPVPAEATPLVKSQSADRDDWRPDQGPVWIPVDLALEELPPFPDNGEPVLVGALAGENNAITVTYSGERRELTDTTSEIGLDVSGAGPGSYTGTVDLLPSKDEAGEVTLGLTIATWWPFPALLLVFGIAMGIWVQRQTGLNQPQAQLLKRIGDLKGRRGKAKRRLDKAAGAPPNKKPWGAFDIGNIEALEDDLRERLASSAQGPVVKIDEEVLKDLKTRVTAVEAQIDLLGEVPEHAKDLEKALKRLDEERPAPDELPPPPDGEGDPRLVAKSRDALTGDVVDADELKPQIEAIDARLAQIATLAGLEARLSELWLGKLRLEVRLGVDKVAELEKSLRGLHQRLFSAVGSEDLTSAAAKAQQAAQLLADLSLEPQPTEPPPSLTIRRLGFRGIGPSVDIPPIEIQTEGTAQIQYVAPPPSPLAPPTSTAAPLPDLPESQLSEPEAERKLESARRSQAIVVVLVGLVAFSSGMQAIYVADETWGSSFWDWLAIFAWGVGVQAAVTTLATSIDAGAVLRRISGGGAAP